MAVAYTADPFLLVLGAPARPFVGLERGGVLSPSASFSQKTRPLQRSCCCLWSLHCRLGSFQRGRVGAEGEVFSAAPPLVRSLENSNLPMLCSVHPVFGGKPPISLKQDSFAF